MAAREGGKSLGGAGFTEGSIIKHIVATTLYGAIGLMTLFLVDLADLYFLSLLGQEELAAAVGYAGTIMFFSTSICIGLAIGTAATVARSIGAGERERARRLVLHNSLASFLLSLPVALVGFLYAPEFLAALGAEGRTLELATVYLRIIFPSLPLLALAMTGGGVLRANALPRLAMWSTVGGGLVNAILDPVLIFGFGWDIVGAALGSVGARIGVFVIAWYGVVHRARVLGHFQAKHFLADTWPFLAVALPAIATNLATPIGNSVVIEALAAHGDDAIAGFAIVSRIIPVVFGAIFALTGAIGPIVGQNYGAGHYERVRAALWSALGFSTLAVALPSVLIYLFEGQIAALFHATPAAAAVVTLFAEGITLSFLFVGALFVANAAFNNLGRPLWATMTNWGRATIGTIPLVWLGDRLFGVSGILWGQALAGVIFGTLAFIAALWLVHKRKLVAVPGSDQRFFRLPLQASTIYRGWIPSGATLRESRRRRDKDDTQ